MEIEEKDIAILHRLGLTALEAKIFTISSKIGVQKIERIASLTGIDRSNAYNIIRNLQKVGLTAEILGKPNLYQSLPMKEAISILLQSKENEFKSIEKDANSFVETSKLEQPTDTNGYKFKIVTKSKKTLEEGVIKRCKNAKQSFDLIISEVVFAHLFINLASDQLDCVKRGVEYRIITEKTALDRFKKEIYPFIKNTNFHIKFLPEKPEVEVIIEDRKTGILHLVPDLIVQGANMLETNHCGCVRIFQNYFDKIWSESQEYKL